MRAIACAKSVAGGSSINDLIARLPPFSPIPGRIGEVQRKLDFSETQRVPHTKSMLPH
jgi:hypothetical protein